jgi:hypothetical protein
MPSTYMKDAIKEYLLTQPSITSYVGTDIYHCARPQGLLTDYICYGVLIPSNDPVVFGRDTANHKWRFDVFSMNENNCWILGEALVTLLNRAAGPFDEMSLYFTTAVGPKVIQDTSDEQWYHGMVDAMIGYVR